jgi:hypothetical protein
MPPFLVRPDKAGARARIVDAVLDAAGRRDEIGDSDLDGEQFVSVQIGTTLGDLRAAGLRYAPRVEGLMGSGDPLDHFEAAEGHFVQEPWNASPWLRSGASR